MQERGCSCVKKTGIWLLAAMLVATSVSGAYALENGIYRDKAPGFGGDVMVTVIIRDGRMQEITTENTGGEKSEYYQKAEEQLIPAILEKQGLDGVDAVSGATGTSESILAAMRGILEQAEYTGQTNHAVNSVKQPTMTPDPKPTV